MDQNGTEQAWNIYGINLLARKTGSEKHFYLYNGHADVTVLLNSTTGAPDATYYYDAFGNILEQTGAATSPILYAGYQYDQETGLYYLNARMYDPKIARFLQEDTYRGSANDPLSLNLYAYCVNNPIRYFDPTGHAGAPVRATEEANGNEVNFRKVGPGSSTITLIGQSGRTTVLNEGEDYYIENGRAYYYEKQPANESTDCPLPLPLTTPRTPTWFHLAIRGLMVLPPRSTKQ